MSLENLDLLATGGVVALATGVGIWRLAKGPTVLDRILCFDLIVITASSLVVIFSAYFATSDFIEFVFVLSALGFLSTVSYFYYLMNLPISGSDSDAEEGQ